MPNLTWLKEWTSLVSSADSVAEFGRKIVHSPITAPTAVGAHVFGLDSRGNIELLGGYGINPFEESGVISAWDDHVLSNTIRERGLGAAEVTIGDKHFFVYAIAILKGDEPLGVATFTQREAVEAEYPKDINDSMSQVLGIWLNGLGLTKSYTNGKTPTESNPQALTERQLRILELMAQGKTNAEIAQELILSESSIRQETVRIYRALGVGSRAEAAKRAIHLGILRSAAV